MTKTIKGYKFIQSDMSSRNGGTKWIIGKWKRHDGGIEMCAKGFHACETAYQSLSYVYGDKWFIVEARGNILKDTNKFVASEMRLIKEIDVKKVLVPFACIVAKRSLANFEKKYPNDKRPREAIDAALKYAKNPTEANRSAAYSAADSAERRGSMTKTIKGYKFIQSDMSSRNGGTKWIIGKSKRHDGGNRDVRSRAFMLAKRRINPFLMSTAISGSSSRRGGIS